MADYDDLLLTPIYSTLATDAVVTLPGSDGEEISLRAIEKTAGDAAALGGYSLQTVRPMAVVRATELSVAGVDPADLDGGEIEINGATWRIKSHRMKPGIAGETAGEVELLLEGLT